MRKLITILIALTLSLLGCKASDKGIEVKGSDTLLELVQMMGETFINKTKIAVNVSGGGSGVGIAALINNSTDIADSSRPIKDKEIQDAISKGIEPIEVKIGIDAIAVIVHPKNPINELNAQQLGAIYKGDLKNWKDIGGNDKPISLYGRQENSGTYVFFQEHLLEKKDYSANMKRMNGNAQIIESIKTDEAGIGYVGIGYITGEKGENKSIKILAIVGKNNKSLLPTNIEAVYKGEYEISRYLFQYISKAKFTGKVKEFIEFELSPEGQEIVKKVGFYPLGEKAKELNSNLYK